RLGIIFSPASPRPATVAHVIFEDHFCDTEVRAGVRGERWTLCRVRPEAWAAATRREKVALPRGCAGNSWAVPPPRASAAASPHAHARAPTSRLVSPASQPSPRLQPGKAGRHVFGK